MKLTAIAHAAALGLAVLAAAPAAAEVTRTTDDSFVSRNEVVVTASPKDVWLALINPAGWWQSAHTWSGDAKNLSLMPQAGGCFCETIPEVDEPGRFTLQGSVEHMRVIQAYPESALRMVGNLGPLQSEPVTGVLTIAISKVPKGTRIVFEYNVGGPMRYEIPVISKSVDGVLAAQIGALAKPLGVVRMPAPVPVLPAPAPAAVMPSGPATVGPPVKPSAAPAVKPAVPVIKPAAAPPVIKPAAMPVTSPVTKPIAPAPKSAPKPSVEDAFSDLGDKPKG